MTSNSAQILHKVLCEHNASAISAVPKVIELESTVKPMEAANILWENNILGAPVWDETTTQYIGFFDMRDILNSFIDVAKTDAEESKISSSTFCFTDVRYENVSYFSSRNPFVHVTDDESLLELCKSLSRKDCRRVSIFQQNNEEHDKCYNLISASAIVKFLASKCSIEMLSSETIEDVQDVLGYKKEVISVLDTTPALNAFTIMDDKRLSGIAVVDEDGKLVGNTSARDIKFAVIALSSSSSSDNDDNSIEMDIDILSYLAKVRQSKANKKERYPCCHVHENDTIGYVLHLLMKTGYHRVFVVDEDLRPIGVISVTDIMNFASQANDDSV